MIAIVRGLPRFDGRSRFSTWAYRVATNSCLDELRRRRRRPLPGLGAEIGRPDHDVTEGKGVAAAGPDAQPSLDAQVADRVDIDAALATLTPEFRAAIVLRDLCQLDYAEIAEVLGIPPGTVRSRIARGRAALAQALEPGPGNHYPTTDRQSSTP